MEAQTVFLVDEDEDLRFVLGELLETQGLRPRSFRSPDDALAALASEREPPRLLLMSGDSHLALVQVVRRDPRWCHIPIILFSGRNDIPIASRLGIPVIGKPHVDVLLSTIAAARSARSADVPVGATPSRFHPSGPDQRCRAGAPLAPP